MLSIISSIDQFFFNFVLNIRQDWLNRFFVEFTFLGEVYVAIFITFILALLFLRAKKWPEMWCLLISVFGSSFTTYVLKKIIARPRPTVIPPLSIETSFSFPSGHATFAVALYGFLLYYFYKNIKDKKKRNALIVLFSFLIPLLAFSRIYLGVHYFSDVLGGLIVGGIWLGLSIYFVTVYVVSRR